MADYQPMKNDKRPARLLVENIIGAAAILQNADDATLEKYRQEIAALAGDVEGVADCVAGLYDDPIEEKNVTMRF